MKLNVLCRRFNLKKVVRSPTRANNVLDQILTNMTNLYNEVIHLHPVGRSDHQCLLYRPRKDSNIKPLSRKARLMRPSKLKLLGIKLDLKEWRSVFNAQDVDDKVNKFTSITKFSDLKNLNISKETKFYRHSWKQRAKISITAKFEEEIL